MKSKQPDAAAMLTFTRMLNEYEFVSRMLQRWFVGVITTCYDKTFSCGLKQLHKEGLWGEKRVI